MYLGGLFYSEWFVIVKHLNGSMLLSIELDIHVIKNSNYLKPAYFHL